MLRFDISQHSIEQFQSRVENLPESIVRRIIRHTLLEEYKRPKGQKKKISVARTFENGSYTYFYLRGQTRAGTIFYLAVDDRVNTVFTTLSAEQFANLSHRARDSKPRHY